MALSGTSATAKEIRLERYEIEMLIEMHQENEYTQAQKRDYREAEESRRRADQLREYLKDT